MYLLAWISIESCYTLRHVSKVVIKSNCYRKKNVCIKCFHDPFFFAKVEMGKIRWKGVETGTEK